MLINQIRSENRVSSYWRLVVYATNGTDRLIFCNYPAGLCITLMESGKSVIFNESDITDLAAEKILSCVRAIRAGIYIEMKIREI